MIEVHNSGTSLYQTSLSLGDLPTVKGEFSYSPGESVQLSNVLRDLEGGYCKADNLKAFGEQLFENLFKSDTLIRGELNRLRAKAASLDELFGIHLRLPPELDYLPWESLSDPRNGRFLGTDSRLCIVRAESAMEPEQDTPSQPPSETPAGLSMLVVMPAGSRLDVDREFNNLKLLQRSMPIPIEITELRGNVTFQRLNDALKKHYDIVHFSGHGEVDEAGAFSVRLNASGAPTSEQWVSGKSFANFFDHKPPTLVVLNCCYGASSARKGRRDFSAVGPMLLGRGVTAVVAMRFEILDKVAVLFAQTFYTELLSGRLRGRVDYAITESRRAIDFSESTENVRGFITPILFLKLQRERLWILPSSEVKPPSPDEEDAEKEEPDAKVLVVPPPKPAYSQILLRCAGALKEKNCIAIIGPGLLSFSPRRSTPLPPTPQELATHLAGLCQYPLNPTDLSGSEGEWLTGMLLPWVCQQFAKENERFKLLEALYDVYKGMEPTSEMKAISKWTLPGVVYLPFDGLLEKALKQGSAPYRPVYGLDSRLSGEIPGTLLLCPTGSLQADPSLVLTEEEQEELHSRAQRMSPLLREHMAGERGRCTVILGASPRDRLVRLLVSRIQEVGQRRTQGPTYFFTRNFTDADRIYWSKYNVQWLTEDPRSLFEVMDRSYP